MHFIIVDPSSINDNGSFHIFVEHTWCNGSEFLPFCQYHEAFGILQTVFNVLCISNLDSTFFRQDLQDFFDFSFSYIEKI